MKVGLSHTIQNLAPNDQGPWCKTRNSVNLEGKVG